MGNDFNVGDKVRVTIEGTITYAMNGEISVRSDATADPSGYSLFNTEYADVQSVRDDIINQFTERELLWIEQTLLHRVASMVGKDGWLLNPNYIELNDLHSKLVYTVTKMSKEKKKEKE